MTLMLSVALLLGGVITGCADAGPDKAGDSPTSSVHIGEPAVEANWPIQRCHGPGLIVVNMDKQLVVAWDRGAYRAEVATASNRPPGDAVECDLTSEENDTHFALVGDEVILPTSYGIVLVAPEAVNDLDLWAYRVGLEEEDE
ncbi:hypothetical protein BJH93_10590 [Kocuria polaris]|nr:hypothetical protein [Kocuria polaris]